jgi:glycosyltransferase involved in cell wall biosynthesis
MDGDDMINISVIVPFYNTERYIGQCIESLLNQEYPTERYEIIFINNNSTDSSADIIRRHPRIKLISERKRGSYTARNRGLQVANGEIIAFTDSDCVPSADWLNKIESATANPDTGIVIGKYQTARESFLLSMLEDYENEKNNYIFTSGIKELYYGYTRNMAVRRGLFDEAGPFLERARGSDVIFIRRCVDRYSCDIVRYSPDIRVRHMEIDSPGRFFRKLFIYGRSSREYSQVVNARPLTNWERFQVFRKTARGRGYSWWKTISLLGLLAVAFSCWVSGTISNALSFKHRDK